jgi:DNA (cytosine-5)-methyltransferase 1
MLPTPKARDYKGPGVYGDGGVDLPTALALLPTPTVQHSARNSTAGRSPDARPHAEGDTLADLVFDGRLLPTPMTVNRTSERAKTGRETAGPSRGGPSEGLEDIAHADRWGEYAEAIARWEHTIGRPAPDPTMTSTKGNPQLAPAFVEWMMGLPAGWVTDVPGITRNEALKACGNGVIPQQAEAALRVLLPAITEAVA